QQVFQDDLLTREALQPLLVEHHRQRPVDGRALLVPRKRTAHAAAVDAFQTRITPRKGARRQSDDEGKDQDDWRRSVHDLSTPSSSSCRFSYVPAEARWLI